MPELIAAMPRARPRVGGSEVRLRASAARGRGAATHEHLNRAARAVWLAQGRRRSRPLRRASSAARRKGGELARLRLGETREDAGGPSICAVRTRPGAWRARICRPGDDYASAIEPPVWSSFRDWRRSAWVVAAASSGSARRGCARTFAFAVRPGLKRAAALGYTPGGDAPSHGPRRREMPRPLEEPPAARGRTHA